MQFDGTAAPPQDRGAAAAAGADRFDPDRIEWLRQQSPLPLPSVLRDCRPGLQLASRSGDLVVFECRSHWNGPYLPPLDSHFVAVALAPAPGRAVWLDEAHAHDGEAPAGEVMIVPAGTPAYLRLADPHHVVVLGLRPRMLYGAAGARPDQPLPSLRAAAGVADAVVHGLATTLLAAARAGGPSAPALADHLARALAGHLLAHHAARDVRARATLGGARLERVVGYLAAHLAEPVALADAAQVAGCSVHHLAHLFKQAMGVSPMRYLLGMRMQLARELVETTQLGMAEIGLRVGLPDPAHFSQAFRAYWKTTPSALRRGHRA